MPRKENTKAKTWERDRRKRMNAYFKTLADLLPPHQEGRKRNKVDILIHASKYIKDLHSRTEELFSAHASEAHKEELARLKKLVTQLFSRTQLLSTLLRDAGISVPAEPALEKISPLKWSNKINVEDAEKYFSKTEEVTNNKVKNSECKREKSAELKVPSKRKSVTSSHSSSKKSIENSDISKDVNSCSLENQENQVNSANSNDDNSEATSNASDTRSKEPECCQTNTSCDIAVNCPVNSKTNDALQKVESQKKVKRKSKKKEEKKSLTQCINNSVTSLTPNTLILSGGKLMPLVTPMTSNIIVNTQQQPANPIILGNSQQNQMIVMQPLTNRVQNPVVSICNQAVINTVQKVTLNTVPSIRTKMVVDSQNWTSNVKNIINATKIGGHKGILPKGKEITETTMTYKVPIPAVHKEKAEKYKEHGSKKEMEVRLKANKSHSKSSKNQQPTETVEEKNEKEKVTKNIEDANSVQKTVLKRSASAEAGCVDEPSDKKRKTDENREHNSASTVSIPKSDFAVTCKSIESLKHVIEKIGEETNEEQDKSNSLNDSEENTETNVECSVLLSGTNQEDISDSSKSAEVLTVDSIHCETKGCRDASVSHTTSPVTFSDEHLKSSNENVSVSPETDFNITINSTLEKSSNNISCSDSKSTLTEVAKTVENPVAKKMKDVCNLDTEFDNLLQVAPKEPEVVEGTTTNLESNKIILNLDTNTTTTLKPETSTAVQTPDITTPSSSLLSVNIVEDESKIAKTSKDEVSKSSLSYNTENTFVPIGNRADGLHSDLSNDIFASLQVPSSSHNPESISPTAAFLMAFPLVSSLNGKTEVLEEEMKEDFKYHSQTPPMLLQIGAMEPNSFKLKAASPPHSTVEKRLKVTCEEKKTINPPVSETVSPNMMVECTTTAKALPKVINDEPLREPYKIVVEKSTTSSSFSNATMYSISNASGTTSVINTSETGENCQNQLTTNLRNAITNTTNENVAVSQINTVSISNKSDPTNCPVQASTCDTNVRYSTSQDFLSSYSTIVENNLTTLQQNANSCSAIQETNASGLTQNVVPDVSQAPPLVSHLTNTNTTTNTSSLPLQTLQMEYTSHMKDKESHSSRVAYGVHGKDPLVDSNIVTNNRLNYTGHIDRVLPTPSQNIQQEYSMRSKEATLPILPSQPMQTVYESQPKDSHVLTTQQNVHQNYTSVHEKDHIIQNSHNDYTIDQNKNVPRKDSYSTGSSNATTSNRNPSYPSKDSISNSSEDHFQRSYTKINKESDSSGTNVVNQDQKLNDVLRSKAQEPQGHRRDTNYNSAKKMDVDPFAQTFSYGVKESMSTQAEQSVLNQNTDNIYQSKRDETQNYSTYSNKDTKKINTSSSNNISNKPLIQNTPVTRYSQQPTSFVATSNYEQSTVTENHAKSTTTVAHNSSNFSILSWTTFSPVGGGNNNNLVQFEQGPSQTDNTEAKTICENYSYVPLHKENPNFSNVLTNDVFSVNSTMANMDKSRMKSGMETQKQSFVDPSKTRNIQTNVPPSSKQNRLQNQTSSNNNDYNKFSTENKNKSKYGMESEYIQNEYSGMEQQSQQQQPHGPKNHQSMAAKQDKTIYPMSNYDSQVNFDLSEVSAQMKYPVETYTSSNFKYPDKSQQQSQNKYQPLVQGQVPSLQHDSGTYNNDGKHGQQQSTTKSKGNQQQHAIRAPVNWMMTPEIKHNANIADIILPPIGKELEFCQNNLFAQTPSYNQGTANQFYNNYDVAAHSFSNLPVLQSEPKRTSEVFYSEEQPFPWSPTKTSIHVEQAQPVKGIDQHIVPSSLPTLVGDLDLGTNIPEKQNFLFGQVPSRVPSDQSKDSIKDKEGNVVGRDFHTVLNNQTVQHPTAGSSFLSVSQLVEHEKAEKSHQQHHQQHHHHHHHHHHHAHQHQQQQQQQARKHQRKSNTSPRGNSKRQLDIRKQGSGNDQLHQRHEEQKSSGHTFPEQGYQQQQQQQQQKYQQNNVHWRNRNCKSNYTAEALIGTNSSVHDTNQDKHASIKFSTNYSQNKFQTSLPTADAVMPLNYFSNADDGSGYGQMVNQNFNSYTYSSNANIYPTSNFITSISNTPTSYMMPLHDNADYMETNAFLLSNVTVTSTTTSSSSSTVTTSTSNVNTNVKNHQHYGKQQNCDKRPYPTNAKKAKRKALDGTMQNLEFPLSGINSPLEDYHHSTTFLPPPPPPHASPLYQNHTQTNVYTKAVNGLPPPPPVGGPQGVPAVATAGFPMNPNMPRGGIVAGNHMTMSHHPSGTSLTNFNLSTIFPEMNDKITGYKPPNGIPPGLSQPPNQSATYAQRTNYTTNPLCHLPQVCLITKEFSIPCELKLNRSVVFRCRKKVNLVIAFLLLLLHLLLE
ncbi:transcription factor SPT20 homolog isoform X1 [Bombus impatiens]|uniref:Transcription factor SPT20 homolog isoform X1 n=1 Tax=Bombus impatiens TaxID=132113 RepID=A0A6P6FDQ1_BOMIM|nr:transcription factor SPT20 homolog isoform X1 [Bombus impatiens]